jgi:hypothetical protein
MWTLMLANLVSHYDIYGIEGMLTENLPRLCKASGTPMLWRGPEG